MAYKQTPGRGISSALLQKDPKKEAALAKIRQAEEAAAKRASIRKLTANDKSIEVGAAMDSIEASNKAGDLFTRKQRAAIGNQAANKTRKANNSSVTVKKTQVVGKKGPEDKYTQAPAQQRMKSTGKTPPAKQMAKKIPTKQMSKLKKKSC